jgi:hypothetical protein
MPSLTPAPQHTPRAVDPCKQPAAQPDPRDAALERLGFVELRRDDELAGVVDVAPRGTGSDRGESLREVPRAGREPVPQIASLPEIPRLDDDAPRRIDVPPVAVHSNRGQAFGERPDEVEARLDDDGPCRVDVAPLVTESHLCSTFDEGPGFFEARLDHHGAGRVDVAPLVTDLHGGASAVE